MGSRGWLTDRQTGSNVLELQIHGDKQLLVVGWVRAWPSVEEWSAECAQILPPLPISRRDGFLGSQYPPGCLEKPQLG